MGPFTLSAWCHYQLSPTPRYWVIKPDLSDNNLRVRIAFKSPWKESIGIGSNVRDGISWSAEEQWTVQEDLVLFRQLFHFGSLQFRPLAPEHRMTTTTTSLNTSPPPICHYRNDLWMPKERWECLPPQKMGGGMSWSLSHFRLKKNSILWRCIPSNQYITGGSECYLEYEPECDSAMMGQSWYVLPCTMGHIACSRGSSQIAARVPTLHVTWAACPHSLARPRVADGGTASRYGAGNILNKQSWTDNKGWPSSLGVGRRVNNPSP
jgi:hypothetical protein